MKTYKLIYLIAIISGAAGLMYEIVWTRLLVLTFGNTTHSIVAVLSAFLGGLALGSILIGSWCYRRSPSILLKVYAFLEFGIGALSLLTLLFLPLINNIYFLSSDGSALTPSLIILKFLLTTIILLPPTILMGGTLPILVSLLERRSNNMGSNVSFLYSLNTSGAILGVIISAFFAIELFGLRETVFIGVIFNVIAGLLALLIPNMDFNKLENSLNKTSVSKKHIVVLVCFFFSGLISIGYEVLWTRVLTPSMGTFIYAFAFILVVYLSGIALGSILYKKISYKFESTNLFAISELGIGFFALCSAFIVSFFGASLFLPLMVIFPASIFMGLSFPAANSFLGNSNHGKVFGFAYFCNTLGCILGGIIASFILIPLIGSSQSIILFSLFNFFLALVLVIKEIKKPAFWTAIVFMIITVFIFLFQRDNLKASTTKQLLAFAMANNARIVIKEDEITSVVAIQGRGAYESRLLVDGVDITLKGLETRLMAHLPIALHPNPKTILDICFGMGSTYHSLLLHKMNVDAVELSPSVVEMSTLFYPDINTLSALRGRIIVNDGRNYVNLSKKKYDIVTIDPPPPFNAAGTTVLYSEDFYHNMLRILNPDSIVSQWVFFGSRPDDVKMVTKSFVNAFPYVIAIKSPGEEGGMYLIGSPSPIIPDKEKINKVFSSKVVRDDLAPFGHEINAAVIIPLIITKEELISETENVLPVTDDHPRTEYFWLRHLLSSGE